MRINGGRNVYCFYSSVPTQSHLCISGSLRPLGEWTFFDQRDTGGKKREKQSNRTPEEVEWAVWSRYKTHSHHCAIHITFVFPSLHRIVFKPTVCLSVYLKCGLNFCAFFWHAKPKIFHLLKTRKMPLLCGLLINIIKARVPYDAFDIIYLQ